VDSHREVRLMCEFRSPPRVMSAAASWVVVPLEVVPAGGMFDGMTCLPAGTGWTAGYPARWFT